MLADQDAVLRFTQEMNRLAKQMGSPHRQAIGDRPRIQDGPLRAALILEEAAETAKGLTGATYNWSVREDVPLGEPNIVEVADGCADLGVVMLGTAVACGFVVAPIFKEVMSNNWTKLGPGATFRADGKLLKPPSWRPPDIRRLLVLQGLDLE